MLAGNNYDLCGQTFRFIKDQDVSGRRDASLWGISFPSHRLPNPIGVVVAKQSSTHAIVIGNNGFGLPGAAAGP